MAGELVGEANSLPDFQISIGGIPFQVEYDGRGPYGPRDHKDCCENLRRAAASAGNWLSLKQAHVILLHPNKKSISLAKTPNGFAHTLVERQNAEM